uniref:Uncharacterized protein TCIL3000_10_10 n=1 Tax=Trypanosoma congolense (strain IL3000) TaxID=1068625 RepID=G0UV28_TRYCI|nr:unnamed protein product [Trypanosoma congolense IL3000]
MTALLGLAMWVSSNFQVLIERSGQVVRVQPVDILPLNQERMIVLGLLVVREVVCEVCRALCSLPLDVEAVLEVVDCQENVDVLYALRIPKTLRNLPGNHAKRTLQYQVRFFKHFNLLRHILSLRKSNKNTDALSLLHASDVFSLGVQTSYVQHFHNISYIVYLACPY